MLFFLLLAVFLFSGAFSQQKEMTVQLLFDDKPVFDKTYKLSFSSSMNVLLFCRNDWKKLYETKYSGDIISFFGYLNADIPTDVDHLCSSLSFPAEDAKVTSFTDGVFSYKEEKTGVKTDTYKTLLSVLYDSPAKVAYLRLSPEKTLPALQEETKLICSFSTSYATSSPARKNNVRLAANRLDGATLYPGDRLSFNETVGARTKENGFCEAGVIQNGEYTSGVGGGVCQVSTTLYNAWLRSGQTAPVSRAHSLVPSYVAPGLDAMVSSESDLVLLNSSEYPMYIDAQCDGKTLTFSVYGKKPTDTYRLQAELVRSIPYDEYEILDGKEDKVLKRPIPRQIYRSYRVVCKENGESIREVLRISDYLPQKGKKYVKKEDMNAENRSQ